MNDAVDDTFPTRSTAGVAGIKFPALTGVVEMVGDKFCLVRDQPKRDATAVEAE